MATRFQAVLTGAQESPPTATVATGTANLTLSDAGDVLSYEITIAGLDFGPAQLLPPRTLDTADDVTSAHFHVGARGTSGPVVFGIINPAQDANNFRIVNNADGSVTLFGNWDITDPANQPISNFAAELRAAAAGADTNLYLNIHSTAFSMGEIRGQVTAAIASNIVQGTGGSDTIAGSLEDDIIFGDGGNDVIFGSDGNDLLYGNDGSDSPDGGAGNDILVGNDNNDYLFGGEGDNIFYGNTGNDFLIAGGGNDTLFGGKENDTIPESIGDDVASGDLGNDSLLGGEGSDSLFGNAGNDSLFGGADRDTLFGGKDTDYLIGSIGNDFINGDLGNDSLIGVDPAAENPGEREVDNLIGGEGADIFILGEKGKAYYDDGNDTTSGTRDYALIRDFILGQDVLQLGGTASNYVLEDSPRNLPQGTAIYQKAAGSGGTDGQNQGQNELIAIVQLTAQLTLELSSFRFV